MNYSKTYLSDMDTIFMSIPCLDHIKQSNIFITGATGLIGSALVDFLVYLNEVHNFDLQLTIGVRSYSRAHERYGDICENKYFHCIEFDVSRPTYLKGNYDFLIHAASLANPQQYMEQPVETMLSNIVGANSLLEYASQHTVKKMIFVSSSEVYGTKTENTPYKEEDYGFLNLLNERACYPSSKRATETLCVAYAKQYNVNVSIVRPGHVYGPTATGKDNRAATQFFNDVLAGKDIVMKTRGAQRRSYCYVMDCVSAILTVLLYGANKQAYNISNSQSICSIFELAQQIADCANKKVVFESASAEELKGYNFMSNSTLDSSALEKLGWKGSFTLKEGVQHTVQIMKERENRHFNE